MLLIQSTQPFSGYLLYTDIFINTLNQQWRKQGLFLLVYVKVQKTQEHGSD